MYRGEKGDPERQKESRGDLEQDTMDANPALGHVDAYVKALNDNLQELKKFAESHKASSALLEKNVAELIDYTTKLDEMESRELKKLHQKNGKGKGAAAAGDGYYRGPLSNTKIVEILKDQATWEDFKAKMDKKLADLFLLLNELNLDNSAAAKMLEGLISHGEGVEELTKSIVALRDG